ncbi:MAG: amino acid adenylation domain-containing protein, partial [Fusobacteriaceae bacterium]
MIIGILGIMKAGGAYVPISPEYPKERINFIIKDINAQLLITEHKYKSLFTEINTIEVDKITKSVLVKESKLYKKTALSPSHLAYVIYTSGTTGNPKGVMIEHKGLLNHLLVMVDEFSISENSKIAQIAPYTFDISVWQILNSLIKGGSTIIYSNDIVRNSSQFLNKIIKDQVSILQVVPSYLGSLIKVDESKALLKIETILITGEAVSNALLNEWFEHYPNKKLINAYGPTEASDDVSFYTIEKESTSTNVSIGKPIQNTSIYILNELDQLLPIGIIGEICIGGIQVARGYLNNAKLTIEKFVANPFVSGERMYRTGDLGRWLPDGNIEYIGRKDDQVKIRGYRIELGEIDAALYTIEEIKACCVLAREDKEGN